jgi:hypothetical protein
VTRSSVLNEFPRINFTRGFTRLTMLSQAEKVGVLFALHVLLHTNKGKELMSKVLDRQQRKYLLKTEKIPPPVSHKDKMQYIRSNSKTTFPRTIKGYEYIFKSIHRLDLDFLLGCNYDHLQLEYFFVSVWPKISRSFAKDGSDWITSTNTQGRIRTKTLVEGYYLQKVHVSDQEPNKVICDDSHITRRGMSDEDSEDSQPSEHHVINYNPNIVGDYNSDDGLPLKKSCSQK